MMLLDILDDLMGVRNKMTKSKVKLRSQICGAELRTLSREECWG